MIYAVTVTNHLGESLRMELERPEKSGFLIHNISGLGPGKADINASEMATGDGSLYTSARLNSRNIVLSIIYRGEPGVATAEDLRQKSYKYFPIKQHVTLTIETENRLAETYGYVESNEPVIFSKMANAQISILCPDPYFYSVGEEGTTTTVFSGIEPIFEFPFENNSLTENLIEFGEIMNKTEQNIFYAGDASIGVTIKIHAIGPATKLSVYNLNTREELHLDTDRLVQMTGSAIVAGDDIVISTVKGNKSVTLLRQGVYTNILNSLTRDSSWFTLSKGDNVFVYTAETGASNLQFKIENKTIYEGV